MEIFYMFEQVYYTCGFRFALSFNTISACCVQVGYRTHAHNYNTYFISTASTQTTTQDIDNVFVLPPKQVTFVSRGAMRCISYNDGVVGI